MLDPLYEAVEYVLAFFYALIPNLGVAIILLTITVMLLLFPLTAKSARSMLAMQRLQPEIKKLQAKHKGDRQKLNEEMMKLYQEHKVNPLGGCLPLLVQFPIFIALFGVLRDTSAPQGTQLYKDVQAAQPDGLTFLGMDLSKLATDSHADFLAAVPYYILVGLVFFTGYLQSKQSQRNTPPGANPQMQMITRVLPLVLGVTSLFFPAGLVLYFFVSNLWRVGQQELIMRKIAPRHELKKSGRAIDTKSSPGKNRATKRPPAEEKPTEEKAAEEKPAEEAATEEEPAEREPVERKRAPRTPAKGATPAEERSGPLGALRGLFQPPAPREDADGPPPRPPKQPASKQPASKQPASGSGSSRAGQSRRRRRRSSNKKRKR
jgi:YidC/Oxa1 family membrane protein insertase